MPNHSLHRLTPRYFDLIGPILQQLSQNRVVDRLWAKDHQLWKSEPTEIVNRLGWLTVHNDMRRQLDSLVRLAGAAQATGIKDVVLLGMGGSSLGPEVLRTSFGSQKGCPRLWVLDSTVPGWVRQVTKAIHPTRTMFLVASKSGGTIEVMSLFAHFWELVTGTQGNRDGEQFVAMNFPESDWRNWRRTMDSAIRLPIRPTNAFSCGTLTQGQAAADLESLRAHHRHAIRVQLGANQAATVQAIVKALASGGPTSRRTASQERRRRLRHR